MQTFWDLTKGGEKKSAANQPGKAADSDSVRRMSQHLQSSHSKVSSSMLDRLCLSKAPAGTIREGDALKQQQGVEKTKLKQNQLKDSKELYAKQETQKKNFNQHQSEVKTKFLAKKPSASQIETFNKVQAADKKSFEAGLVKENVALYNKHKAQDKDQLAWHAKQSKELEAKYAPAKPSVKPAAKPAAPKAAAAAKPVAVVEIPVQDCGPGCKDETVAANIPVAKIDGTTAGLVYIPA